MKQLQRLLFLQGNKCFFCDHPIAEGQASVEHLDALSNGGIKSDENSVVCCKTVNAALGNLSVKDKFRIVLSHKRPFACPAVTLPEPDTKPQEILATEAQRLLPQVVRNLRKRGVAKPNNSSALRKSVATSFEKASPAVIEAVLVLLKQRGYTEENGGKLSYPGLR